MRFRLKYNGAFTISDIINGIFSIHISISVVSKQSIYINSNRHKRHNIAFLTITISVSIKSNCAGKCIAC
ncbi:botulinum neurotoxin N-terminal receptor binding domain-containing protein [Flavobacterium sp.]|uniref:botulinum neurotoxin N-terminal receptor binding domain-containing protein n=1 Tax=Flavobacterium sp. TaxID=239 RepID=UPI00343F9DCA